MRLEVKIKILEKYGSCNDKIKNVYWRFTSIEAIVEAMQILWIILQNDPSDRMFQFKEESVAKTTVKPDLTNFG